MIELTKIRIKNMSLELPNRKNLEELRALLASRFGTKRIFKI